MLGCVEYNIGTHTLFVDFWKGPRYSKQVKVNTYALLIEDPRERLINLIGQKDIVNMIKIKEGTGEHFKV